MRDRNLSGFPSCFNQENEKEKRNKVKKAILLTLLVLALAVGLALSETVNQTGPINKQGIINERAYVCLTAGRGVDAPPRFAALIASWDQVSPALRTQKLNELKDQGYLIMVEPGTPVNVIGAFDTKVGFFFMLITLPDGREAVALPSVVTYKK
jgi:hypothetical protein